VLALTLVGPILTTFTVVVAWVAVYLAAPAALSSSVVTHAAFLDSFRAFIEPVDMVAMLVKTAIAGFFVGLVSTYKGMNSSGGTEGVGRAVNESVLICFVGVWAFNILMNVMIMSVFPGLAVLRG
jgi:phospholipid/cholesterol/gamma-HCH transport system permease protein